MSKQDPAWIKAHLYEIFNKLWTRRENKPVVPKYAEFNVKEVKTVDFGFAKPILNDEWIEKTALNIHLHSGSVGVGENNNQNWYLFFFSFLLKKEKTSFIFCEHAFYQLWETQ